jgi:hypothetical protein
MPGVFQDTVFAHVIRAVLGPTYFPHIGEMDPPSVYLQTVHFPKSTFTSTTIGSALGDLEDPFNVHGRHGGNGAHIKRERSAGDSGYAEALEEPSREFKLPKPVKEEGSDSLLVTWRGPDDPEVCSVLLFVPHQIDDFAKNPMNWSRVKKIWVMFQLCFLTFSVYFGSAVYTAAVPGVSEHFHVSHVASTLGLTLFLLGCGIGRSFNVSKSLPSLNCNLLDRTYVLVAIERDALYRPDAYLLGHTIPICSPSNSHSPIDKFRHALGVPLHYWLCRLANPCDGRCNYRGLVQSQKTGIRHDALGYLCRMCPRNGPHCRRFYCPRGGLEMDNMVTDVVGQFYHYPPFLLLPRDIVLQHSLPPREAPSQGYG